MTLTLGLVLQLGGGGLPSTASASKWLSRSPMALDITSLPHMSPFCLRVRALPEDVIGILESLAQWAAGYDSGLKWNEEDKLKADMMNRPERWTSVTIEQVRSKCRELKMRPNDVKTIVGFLERRKQGRRFNVRSTYRDYHF